MKTKQKHNKANYIDLQVRSIDALIEPKYRSCRSILLLWTHPKKINFEQIHQTV